MSPEHPGCDTAPENARCFDKKNAFGILGSFQWSARA